MPPASVSAHVNHLGSSFQTPASGSEKWHSDDSASSTFSLSVLDAKPWTQSHGMQLAQMLRLLAPRLYPIPATSLRCRGGCVIRRSVTIPVWMVHVRCTHTYKRSHPNHTSYILGCKQLHSPHAVFRVSPLGRPLAQLRASSRRHSQRSLAHGLPSLKPSSPKPSNPGVAGPPKRMVHEDAGAEDSQDRVHERHGPGAGHRAVPLARIRCRAVEPLAQVPAPPGRLGLRAQGV